jgi:hypothetical protein
MSVSLLFEKSSGSIAQRAAKLVAATLEYRRSLLDHSLERETSGESVIDNYRNHNFFGRVANIRKTGLLKWVKDIKHRKDSSHIVVAVNGAYYKLDVIDGSAMMARERFCRISTRSCATEADKSAETLWSADHEHHRWSEKIFYADKLDDSIRTIDEAIFLLAIDNGNVPADENEAAQDLHIRCHHNRDYRKSLQVVVLENGFSGATINFFAEIEGVFAARFASWVGSYASNMPQIVAEETSDDPVRLEFETIDFDEFPLRKIRDKIARYSCGLPLIKRIDAIGRNGIKQLNVSPDAFFHAAAHLAYYESSTEFPRFTISRTCAASNSARSRATGARP